jgi:predicted Rossmann fold nucleotide-binding protein DprA/Smf involved in DNA uptake
MKEYRLVGWPELRPPFMRTAHRRLLAEMSQRHMTASRLARTSGLRPLEVQAFIEMLDARGLIASRDRSLAESLATALQTTVESTQRRIAQARSLFR